jgi:hypothetical protein
MVNSKPRAMRRSGVWRFSAAALTARDGHREAGCVNDLNVVFLALDEYQILALSGSHQADAGASTGGDDRPSGVAFANFLLIFGAKFVRPNINENR